jgi:excisionase family DNA binding protein
MCGEHFFTFNPSQDPQPSRPPSLTSDEVSERLNVSRRTVQHWGRTGILAAYRVGPRLIRYDATEVDALARRVEPAQVTAS